MVRGRSAQKISNLQELLPKVVTGSPKQLKLLRQDLGELCPKTLGLSLPRTTGIVDHTNSTTNKELRPKTFESKRFPGV
jgi:hypothetical protein